MPHCNGQCERSIQSLKNILAQLLEEFHDDWDQHLNMATFIYIVNFHSAIKTSPFYAVCGYTPITPGIMQWLPLQNSNLSERLKSHADFLKNLRIRVMETQAKNKLYFDKKRKSVAYETGQLVRIKNEKRCKAWPKSKLQWKGPFSVVGKKSPRFYFILIPTRTISRRKKYLVKEYHVRNMRPFIRRPKYLRT